jgi:hypothetical protein
MQAAHEAGAPWLAGERTACGDADRAAGLACRVVHRRREACPLAGDRADRCRDHRGREHAHAGAPQQQSRHQREEARVGVDSGEQHHPGRGDDQAGGHRALRSDASGQPAGERRQHAQRREERDDREPGLERGAALHALQVQREHEEQAEGAEVHRAGDRVRGGEVDASEELER